MKVKELIKRLQILDTPEKEIEITFFADESGLYFLEISEVINVLKNVTRIILKSEKL